MDWNKHLPTTTWKTNFCLFKALFSYTCNVSQLYAPLSSRLGCLMTRLLFSFMISLWLLPRTLLARLTDKRIPFFHQFGSTIGCGTPYVSQLIICSPWPWKILVEVLLDGARKKKTFTERCNCTSFLSYYILALRFSFYSFSFLFLYQYNTCKIATFTICSVLSVFDHVSKDYLLTENK